MGHQQALSLGVPRVSWGESLQKHMCCISPPVGLSPLLPQTSKSVAQLIPMFSACPSAPLRGTHTSGTLSHLSVPLAL